jgi:hypothetical protein
MTSAVVLLLRIAGTAFQADTADADRLYAQRTNIASARRAVELWTAALARNPKDFDAAWKLSRADYWLGGHVSERERSAFFDDGIERGRTAAALGPDRPEGHFWLAVNMGAAAELSTRAGLKYRAQIRSELETVLRVDRAFLQGSADRALGRWYARVPRLFGGNKKLAEEHLRRSLQYNSHSTASHFFLAELMIDDGRPAEARAELQQVLDAPLEDEWEPENQEFKMKARAVLLTLGK